MNQRFVSLVTASPLFQFVIVLSALGLSACGDNKDESPRNPSPQSAPQVCNSQEALTKISDFEATLRIHGFDVSEIEDGVELRAVTRYFALSAEKRTSLMTTYSELLDEYLNSCPTGTKSSIVEMKRKLMQKYLTQAVIDLEDSDGIPADWSRNAPEGTELYKEIFNYAYRDELGLKRKYQSDAERFTENVLAEYDPYLYFLIHRAAFRFAYYNELGLNKKYQTDAERFAKTIADQSFEGLRYLAIYKQAFYFSYRDKEGLNEKYQTDAERFANKIATMPRGMEYLTEYKKAFDFAYRDPDGLRKKYQSDAERYADSKAKEAIDN